MSVVFGLGTRLCAHLGTPLENGVLCNGHQLGRAAAFINQDEFVKHQFRDQLAVSREPFLRYHCLTK